MPRFSYQAVDAKGRFKRGRIAAESISQANENLFQEGLQPISVKADKGDSSQITGSERKNARKVRAEDLIFYTKQFITMLRAGLPIAQCLKILETQTDHPTLARISRKIREDIQDGANLSEALKKHSKVFPHLYITIVSAGEKSGKLPEAMTRLTQLIEHEENVKSEVKAALRYPALVVGALIAAFVVMVGFVLPAFAGFFENADIELPLPTRICLGLSEFLTSQAHWIIAAVLIAFIGLRITLKNPFYRLKWDRFLLDLPYIGPVLTKAAMTRFASIFSILSRSGMLVLESIDILAQTFNNRALSAEFIKIRQSLEEGKGLAQPLRSVPLFPPMFVSMVAIGEETGRLEELLEEISEHYDTELNYTLKKMTGSIGPLLILGLTFIVAFFALAVYLPMWDLAQMAM